jgi:hypothetical protein
MKIGVLVREDVPGFRNDIPSLINVPELSTVNPNKSATFCKFSNAPELRRDCYVACSINVPILLANSYREARRFGRLFALGQGENT